MMNPTEKGVHEKNFSCKKGVCDKCGVCIQIQSVIEKKKRKLNITTIYRGRNIMNLADELDLCDDGNIYQTKISYIKLVSYLGFNPKLAMLYPIKVGICQIGKWKEKT